MTQITTNGRTYSDDGSAALDMRNGGHRQWLLPMLGDVLTDVSGVAAAEAAAAASAAAAANSATAILATSTTSFTPGTGSKTFVTQAGKQFAAGQYVTVTSASELDHQMHGQVTSYSGTSLVVNVTTASGADAKTDWAISLSAPKPVVEVGVAPVKRSARSADATLVAADIGYLIDATGTFTQTFPDAATLGDGWWCFYRNSGTGTITLTTDGFTYPMWPGEVRLIQCDGETLRSIVLRTFQKTWTTTDATPVVPPGYTSLGYKLASGSGGGGSGARMPNSTIFFGGNGGGGGGYYEGVFSAVTTGEAFTVTVGAGGVGGAAKTTDNSTGTAGTNGGASSISGAGMAVTVEGGYGGQGGDNVSWTPTAVRGGQLSDVAARVSGILSTADFGGGSSSGFAGNGQYSKATSSIHGGGGGTGGVGRNSTNWTSANPVATSKFGGNGGTGGSSGVAGGNGSAPTTYNGGGGGGGGGGASLNGTNSGKGGDGVAGFVTLWGVL